MTTEIFKLPDLGEGLPEAEIREWYVTEGQEVKQDQPLVSMETAKAVVDVPSPHAGKITKLYGKPGEMILTGAPLIAFGDAEMADAGTVVGVMPTSNQILEEPAMGVTQTDRSTSGIKATPAVKMQASKLKVDLSQLTGSGPGGTITMEDVQRAAAQQSTPILGEALHGVRRVMAQQMAKSHAEVVPVTLTEDANISQWPKGTDVTLRLLQAIVAACQAEPALNAHFYGQTLSRKLNTQVNIGIAVDTPQGLYVPVIKAAESCSTTQMRETLEQFKIKAKNQTFAPEDLQNTTITLSNFGTIAGRYASPVVVPPTVAIIAVGRSRPTVLAVDNAAVIQMVMPISLTFDHRAATGGEAARFLAAFIRALELMS
ncbi:MAG: dihydrolipoamide acetyltransferase family protein [Gammaproteobacteria bacterium]